MIPKITPNKNFLKFHLVIFFSSLWTPGIFLYLLLPRRSHVRLHGTTKTSGLSKTSGAKGLKWKYYQTGYYLLRTLQDTIHSMRSF